MLHLRTLKTFLAAAETLSFTRAAERVHLSQSSVSDQMQSLEALVGQALFERRNNHLNLTLAGSRLVPHARKLLEAADLALMEVRNGHCLRLAAPGTLARGLVTPAIAELSRHVAGTAHVRLRELNSGEVLRAVREGEVEVGVVHGRPADEVPLSVQQIAVDRPVLVVSAGHHLSALREVSPSTLASESVMLTPAGCTYRRVALELMHEADAPVAAGPEADSVPSLLAMVKRGLGSAILPSLAVQGATGVHSISLRTATQLPVCAVTGAGASPIATNVLPYLREAAAALMVVS